MNDIAHLFATEASRSEAQFNLELYNVVTRLIRSGKSTGLKDIAVKLCKDAGGAYNRVANLLTKYKKHEQRKRKRKSSTTDPHCPLPQSLPHHLHRPSHRHPRNVDSKTNQSVEPKTNQRTRTKDLGRLRKRRRREGQYRLCCLFRILSRLFRRIPLCLFRLLSRLFRKRRLYPRLSLRP
ncbi:hypothetical protein C8J56DRAFT_141339 [Mycena floridula]|nr:hypothetical protein C8J56DRAFT_141339 [Mycena floridula]